MALLLTALIALASGFALTLLCRGASTLIYAREGFVVVAFPGLPSPWWELCPLP